MSEINEVSGAFIEPGLTAEENLLLNTPLPHDLTPDEMEQAWNRYQTVIGQLLRRMASESSLLESMARTMLVGSLDGVYTRLALIPMLGSSALHAVRKHGITAVPYQLAAERALMELSAAAGYRTFCFPDLVKGLLKTGKMKERSVSRMMDTFEFLNCMMQKEFNDPEVLRQLERTNGLHARYKVAGAADPEACDLFKYIALNMFYIGPRMRPDITPQERHAICGLTVLVSKRMGHALEGSVHEFEEFIARYEATKVFKLSDEGVLRRRAVEIAHASMLALYKLPTISPARIHSLVPYWALQILKLRD